MIGQVTTDFADAGGNRSRSTLDVRHEVTASDRSVVPAATCAELTVPSFNVPIGKQAALAIEPRPLEDVV